MTITVNLSLTVCKIIEEQLAFPSGTATAQLISVLHQLPPPDTSVRRRHGYREIAHEYDEATVPSAAAESLSATPIDEVDIDQEALVVPGDSGTEDRKPEGWGSLVWSFLVSGVMTVSPHYLGLCWRTT